MKAAAFKFQVVSLCVYLEELTYTTKILTRGSSFRTKFESQVSHKLIKPSNRSTVMFGLSRMKRKFRG